MTGWWLSPTPLKNMKISWDDYSQYMESHKIHVPNHQPDHVSFTGWWGVLTILKNDGVRQWVSDDIPYMKWNNPNV